MTLSQAGVVFNSNYNWDVHDGPWEEGGFESVGDFQRVAVHELGHALGLDHEDRVPAIMNTAQKPGNTITVPQPDDIEGVNAIYPRPATLTANPNPIQVCDGSGLGVTTLSWNALGISKVEIRIGSPSGKLFVPASEGPGEEHPGKAGPTANSRPALSTEIKSFLRGSAFSMVLAKAEFRLGSFSEIGGELEEKSEPAARNFQYRYGTRGRNAHIGGHSLRCPQNPRLGATSATGLLSAPYLSDCLHFPLRLA